MKRFVCLLAVLLLLVVPALAGSPWWDDLLDGVYLDGYDGPVLYDMDVIEAPISFPEPVGYFIGRAIGNGSTLTFVDGYGLTYAGTYNEDTGCYHDWNEEYNSLFVALCYDGDRAMDIYYATLRWNGSQAIMTGPWFFHIYVEAVRFPQKNIQAVVE